MGRSGPVTCRCHPGSLCVRLQPRRVRAPWVGQGQQPGQRPPRGAERAARGGTGSGHVTSGPEALASETPGDRVVSGSVERARRSRGSLQLRVPRVHRHGLDQVPAVPGRAHARHRLHQHALGKVSLGPAGRGGGSAGPAAARTGAGDPRSPSPSFLSRLHWPAQVLRSVHAVSGLPKGCEGREIRSEAVPRLEDPSPGFDRCVLDPSESPPVSAPQFPRV